MSRLVLSGDEEVAAMSTTRLLAVYGLTLVAFLALDAVWLGLVAKGFYQRTIGHLLAPEIRWGAALLFYLIYVAAVLVLVVLPTRGSTVLHTAALGAVLGLAAYAAYDLTNLATMRGFPTVVAVVDPAWGAVLTAATSLAGRLAAARLLPLP